MPIPTKDIIQDCNLNFLIGSGLSSPYLRTLGQIETLLTLLDDAELPQARKDLIRCSIYKAYFDGVMSKNCEILGDEAGAQPTQNAYCEFVKVINTILLQRKSTILGKEANFFTTNIDIFLEKAIERVGMDCNDGFNGRFEPRFAISNFKKTHFKRSLQYDNLSELPTVNLLKLHGSLTWQVDGSDGIVFSPNLRHVRDVRALIVTPSLLLRVAEGLSLDALVSGSEGLDMDATVVGFLDAYERLPIVNPTKAKFRQTLLSQTHYELLRIYSNELEKENTVLFALGFSFADEHIREITLRAANSNPTLMTYVIAYDSNSATEIRARFPPASTRNDNIEIVAPLVGSDGQDAFRYDLPTINKKLFRPVCELTGSENPPGTRGARAT
jgi:hypothetical protein